MTSAPISLETQSRLQALLSQRRYGEAENLCRRLLQGDKANKAHLLLLLGQIQQMSGDLDGATQSLRRATSLSPRRAAGFTALAATLLAAGKHPEALEAQSRAGACPDADASVLQNLGSLLWQANRHRDAIAAFAKAAALDPCRVVNWQALGRLHGKLGEYDAAETALVRVTTLRPNSGETWLELTKLRLQLARPNAIDSAAKALALTPTDETCQRCWLDALVLVRRLNEAAQLCADLLATQPADIALALKQAQIYLAQGRIQDATGLYDELLVRPGLTNADTAAVLLARGRLAYEKGDPEHAFADVEAAVQATPDDPAIRMNYGWQLLARGDLRRGWEEFEHRFEAGLARGGILPQPLPQPKWRGESLNGRVLLLWGEQGIGDDILQCSALAEVIEQAKTVHLLCDSRLIPILQRGMPGSLILHPRGEHFPPEILAPGIDYQCSTGTMLRYLRPDFSSFPAGRRAYLQPDAGLVATIRERYAALPGRKIGLAWKSKNLLNGADKSCPLPTWRPILSLPDTTFVNLQYGEVTEELEALQRQHGIAIHHDRQIDQLRDMDGFLAQICALDAVVSISNAAAHAAGAVGVPTFVLLSANPLWVWFHGRDDSPWYPSARLFRQERLGEWEPVLRRAATALAAHLTTAA